MIIRSASSKVVSIEELARLRPHWREQGMTFVWTNGCFDLLHPGHVHNLIEARALGDVLVVGINSDRSVRELKGHGRPVLNQDARIALVSALEAVDYVTVFDDADPISVLERLHPDIHCKGADYASGKKPIPERHIIECGGGRVHFLEFVPGFSTSGIIERIRALF